MDEMLSHRKSMSITDISSNQNMVLYYKVRFLPLTPGQILVPGRSNIPVGY